MIDFKRYLLIFFIAMFISIPANSMIVGFGAASCGEMISDDKGDNDLLPRGYRSWIQGYVSAMNNHLGADRYSDIDSMYYQVLKYCKDNPLDMVADGVIDLYKKLKDKN